MSGNLLYLPNILKDVDLGMVQTKPLIVGMLNGEGCWGRTSATQYRSKRVLKLTSVLTKNAPHPKSPEPNPLHQW